jgi:hypothetical protein
MVEAKTQLLWSFLDLRIVNKFCTHVLAFVMVWASSPFFIVLSPIFALVLAKCLRYCKIHIDETSSDKVPFELKNNGTFSDPSKIVETHGAYNLLGTVIWLLFQPLYTCTCPNLWVTYYSVFIETRCAHFALNCYTSGYSSLRTLVHGKTCWGLQCKAIFFVEI